VAKAAGKYVGHPEDKRRNIRIASMLAGWRIVPRGSRGDWLQPRHGREDR
jgi:hypothetical protein